MTKPTPERLLAAGKHRLRRLEKRLRRTDQPDEVSHAPLNERAVLYESFSGAGMLCQPEAIFRALRAAPDFADLEHVWVLSGAGRPHAVLAEFADDPRVRFVAPGTAEYRTALATSKYLVNNGAFPAAFAKRPGQVYLNTGHGTPVRAAGYDQPGGGAASANLVRNLVSADYLLAPNEATAQMYLTAYRLRNLYRGRIIAEGSPRIDHQFSPDDTSTAVRARLRAGGAVVDDRQRIVLYAPTLRGDFASPTNDIRQLQRQAEALQARLDPAAYRVLLKLHPQVYQYLRDDPALRAILVPPQVPANVALAATDVLVTDYSSIFIDHLASNRPVLFLTAEPGSADAPALADRPGPICTDIDDLAARISTLDPAAHAEAYAAARARYCPRDDGAASARVIDIVFRGRAGGYDVRADFADQRQSILLSLGTLGPTDLTTAGLNLLDTIDYSRFDVTVSYSPSADPEHAGLAAGINPNARRFPRLGRVDDWAACFGDARFDFVVDFSGASTAWQRALLAGRPGSLSIWQHGDMQAEAAKTGAAGRRLQGLLEVYRSADHLVSVSAPLAELNRAHLGEVGAAKFTFARNTVNGARIRKLAFGASDASGAPTEPAAADLVAVAAPAAPGEASLPATMDQLLAFHSIDDVREEVWRTATIRTVLPDEPGVRTFVTVGPLSAPSNHKRLLRAFDRIHQADPNTRLVIIGSGPLDETLEKLALSLGLASAVIFAGEQDNPYGVMARSDCFVLSGEQGGQPLIVLEALVLGLPVITTAPGADRGPLPDGYANVVVPNVDALAEGMRKFLRGEIKPQPFDYEAYNRVAVEEFYRAIGAAG